MTTTQLLTTSQVAAQFGWPESTVRHWCKTGLLRHTVGAAPTGHYYLIRACDAARFTPPQRGRKRRPKPVAS